MGLATIIFIAPLLALMPQATLAAIVIVYSIGLIKPSEFRAILEIRRTEFTWALAAFAGVVLFGTLKGIIVAIVLSLVGLAYQVSDPPVYVLRRKPGTNVFRPQSKDHPEDETFPGLLLIRLEGRVFFANAELVGQKIRLLVDQTQPSVIALDMSAVFDLEYTALKSLGEGEKTTTRSRRGHMASGAESRSTADGPEIAARQSAWTRRDVFQPRVGTQKIPRNVRENGNP